MTTDNAHYRTVVRLGLPFWSASAFHGLKSEKCGLSSGPFAAGSAVIWVVGIRLGDHANFGTPAVNTRTHVIR